MNRLEFAAAQLSGYSPGDKIVLDGVKVNQPFSAGIPSSVVTAGDKLVCIAEHHATQDKALQVLDGASPATAATTYLVESAVSNTWAGLALSAAESTKVYRFDIQHGPQRIERIDLTTGGQTALFGSTYILHDDVRSMFTIGAVAGSDAIYVGCDGGIARSLVAGTWKSLNGTGFNTSWTVDVGSSIYTGEVGLAAADNHWMWSQPGNRNEWTISKEKNDGAQIMYGKRTETKNARFYGRSGSTHFMRFNAQSTNSTALSLASASNVKVYNWVLSKAVATYGGEFVGSGDRTDNDDENYDPAFPIYKVLASGSTPPYTLDLHHKISLHSTYTPPPSVVSDEKKRPVRSLAPDLRNANYLMSYHSWHQWDPGYFAYAYSSDAFASQPAWDMRANSTGKGLMTLVADPRSSGTTKRLWAGVAGYGDASQRVFVTTLNATPGSWAPMSTGLPDGPVNILVYDEQSRYLFAGTDQGVYSFNVGAKDAGSPETWKCYSLNMPNAYVTDLDINHCTGKIYASLMGRGVYEADLPRQYNADGHTSGGVGPTDTCDFNYISSSTTWTGEVSEMRSIFVKSGVTLKLYNCTLNMGRGKKIIVAVGGKLIVDNSTITNACGYFWDGIQAWGNHIVNQSTGNQGVVIIQRNSVIEHATVGVRNLDPHPIYPDAGGVIQATNSTFVNNKTDVVFEEYHNSSGTADAPNISYFYMCNFLLKPGYRQGVWAGQPERLVWLRGVEGVKFKGCRFSDWYHSFAGGGVSGIEAVNARFSVETFCPAPPSTGLPAPPCIRSAFSGLTYGVNTRDCGLLSEHPFVVTIDQADFDTVSVGVNIVAQKVASVTRCGFRIGRGARNPFVEDATGLPPGCGRNIGILAQAATQYIIEGNTFSGVTNSFGVSPWHNIGVMVISQGGLTNRIYRSSFDHLTFGVLGLNNGIEKPSGNGLQVSCNSFLSNVNDIYSGGTDNDDGIGVFQHGPSYTTSASNSFSSSTKNVVNPNFTRPLYYYDHGVLSTISGNVTPTAAGIDVCPAVLPAVSSGSGGPTYFTATTTSLDKTELAAYKAAFYSAKAALQVAYANYEASIDGGNTDSLLVVVDTSSNMQSLFQSLGQLSPYLSKKVLTKVATVTSQTNYQDVVDLLEDNPEVISDYEFLGAIADISNMTTQDFDGLWATASSTLTARNDLEEAIRASKSAVDENAVRILMALRSPIDTNVSVSDTTYNGVCLDTASIYFLLDSNTVYPSLDTLNAWLQNINDFESKYELAGIQYYRGNYQLANSLFNAIDTSAMTGSEKSDYYGYKEIWNVLYPAALDGRKVWDLDSGELAALGSTPEYPDLTAARSLALKTNIRVSPTIPTYPCEAAAPAGKHVYGNGGNSTLQKFYRIRVLPNPAHTAVTFEYNITPVTGSAGITVTVSNVLGQTVMKQQTDNWSGKLRWDVATLPEGVYIYRAQTKSGPVGEGKITILH